MKKIIVWFRKDLRMHDNPALWGAAQQGEIIPVFIWSEEEEREYARSEAARWWLHHSLLALEEKLKSHRLTLILRRGNSLEQLASICTQTEADAVFYSERYEPSISRRDDAIAESLLSYVSEVRSFSSSLLFPPSPLLNQKMNHIESLHHFGKERCVNLSFVHYRYQKIWFRAAKKFRHYKWRGFVCYQKTPGMKSFIRTGSQVKKVPL